VNDLTDPAGIVALAAASLALIALIALAVLSMRVRRLRSAQTVVLGPSGREDLVAHATGLHQAFDALHERVEEVAANLEDRMSGAEARLDGAIAYRALIRYDAYGELSGRQSSSLALLDAHGDGVVLSCITHRDTARLYCKQVIGGQGEHELSPEEDEAIAAALTPAAP
jgi:Protein of unknown function (DUF4446)